MKFPPGWDEDRVRKVLELYESQSEDEAVAEDEAAARPTVQEWLERTRRQNNNVDTTHVTEALDELRGPWPDGP